MNEKKNEHDVLEKRDIYELWNKDLDDLNEVVKKYEQQEENDRKAQGGRKADDKKKKKVSKKE